MTSPPENVSSIADRLGRLKLTVEANLIDNEDLIGDAGDLPPSSVEPVKPDSISFVTLAQYTPLPRSPPTDAAAAPRSGSANSNSSDPSISSINTSELMTPGRSAQPSGTSPSGDSESQTESFFYLTTSASPFVRRSSLSHPSLILHPSTSQPASSTTHSSPCVVPSMTSQSTSSHSPSSKPSPTSNLLPLAPPFQPASQSPSSSPASPPAPLVTLASARGSPKITIKAPTAASSSTAMSDTSQQATQPAVQATPPRSQPGESPAQTPGWVCQTPVWVTAPEGVGMATPSPTLTSFQASSPADAATSPKGVMSFSVPSPIKTVGDGSPSPTRTAFSFGSSMSAVFQPASPTTAFDKPPPSKAVPITKPSVAQSASESVSLLGDIPEAEDLLTEDDSKDTSLADQLAKARVVSAGASSQASSTGPADLRPTHTPLDRNLYNMSENQAEPKETPVLAPKSSEYGNISLAASLTGSTVGQTTLVGDNPIRLPSESEGPKRSASAASLSSTPGKEVSVKNLAAMYDQQAGKNGRSAVTPGFSVDTAQPVDDAETVTGNESDARVNSPTATFGRLSKKGLGTGPLIAAPGFRPQSSVYDADNETDTDAAPGRGKDTDTETEEPKAKSRKLAKDATLSSGSANLDDITEKPFVPTITKASATKPEPAATDLVTASNGLDDGKAEVEELERLWTDFKDGIALFGGGIDEVIARLTKEFKK